MGSLLFGQRAVFIALVLLIACFGAAEAGYRLGRRGNSSQASLKKDHIGATQAAVAALLGLLLAFSLSMAVSRFEMRKTAVVDEANAVGTAYLRASLLPEPQRSQAVDVFKKYVDVRLQLARPDWYLSGASDIRAQQTALQRELWSIGAAASQLDQRAVTTGLYVQAVNEVIDSAARRDAGLRNHVPESVLWVILAVSIATLAVMGYASGFAGGRSLIAALVITVVVAAVFFVILDFDRPYQGIISVGQQSMLDLRDSMSQALPLP